MKTERIPEIPRVRHGADLLALFFLVGAFAVAFVALMVVTGFLDRVHTAMATVDRTDSLDYYPGRPARAQNAAADALNYLVFVSDSDEDLNAAIVLHLSADRNKMTLIVLPPSLAAESGGVTLGQSFAHDPRDTWRAVETLTDIPMDHQMIIWADKLDGVIRAMGGISLAPDGEQLEASRVYGWVTLALNDSERAERASEVVRAVLIRFSVIDALSNPNQFDEVMNQLTHCLEVDQGLSDAELQSTIMELRVNPSEIRPIFVAATTNNTTEAKPAIGVQSIDVSTEADGSLAAPAAEPETPVEPDAATLLQLRHAFQTDDFTGLG